jgi:hypothetical protein
MNNVLFGQSHDVMHFLMEQKIIGDGRFKVAKE